MEEIYIGTKIIAAEEMDECTFLKTIKGQEVTNRETRPGYKVRYEDGYISWSPKETFERAYRKVSVGEIEMILPGPSAHIDQVFSKENMPEDIGTG